MKKTRRILPLFLALVMVLSCFVAVPFSAEEANTDPITETGADLSKVGYMEDKVVPITAASITMTAFSANTASDATYISINSAEELILFSELVNCLKATDTNEDGKYDGTGKPSITFSGKTVFLTDDIDMDGATMLPIGVRVQKAADYVYGTAFYGTFDGQGYVIDNLNVTVDVAKMPTHAENGDADAAWIGLFGRTWNAEGTTTTAIRNVVLGEGVTVSGNTNSDWGSVGGLLGAYFSNGAVVENIYSAATVTNAKKAAGGIVGRGDVKTVLSNVTFAGSVTSAAHTGGILGYNMGFEIKDSLSAGEVYSTGTIAGGFTSRFDGGTSKIENCANYSSVKVNSDGNTLLVGGFIGRVQTNPSSVSTLTLTDLTNGTMDIGVDHVTRNVFVDNFYNLGDTPLWQSYPNGTANQTNLNKVTVNATNCLGEMLEAGYNQGLIKEVTGEALGTKITAETKVEDINAGTTFYIEDTAGFLRFAQLINEESNQWNGLFNTTVVNANDTLTVTGKTVYLTADIDMKGVEHFVPIGTRANNAVANGCKWDPTANNGQGDYVVITADATLAPVKNTNAAQRHSSNQYTPNGLIFDGQGHSIKNLELALNSSKIFATGLFGYSGGSNAVIRNLVMDESCTIASIDTNYDCAGAFIGYNSGTAVTNCLNMANVYAGTTSSWTGGFIGGGPGNGALNGTYFCTNMATVRGVRAGGMNGGRDDSGTAVNCLNLGTIVGYGGFASGITNGSRGGCQVRNNLNAGPVMNNYDSGCAAGVLYLANNGTNTCQLEIRNNYNLGAIASCTNTVWAYESGVVVYSATNATNVGKESIDDLYEKVVAGTQLFTVWGNYDLTYTSGYSTEFMVTKDLTKVMDIKNVWMITPGDGAGTPMSVMALTRGAAPKQIKITDAEGMRILSAVVYSGNKLADTTIYLANDIDMSDLKFNLEDTDFAESDTFFPIGYYNGNDVLNPTNVAGLTESTMASYTKYFSGNFDGQGHTIYNWTIDQEEVTAGGQGLRVGLFGLAYNATIQNFIFDSSNKITGATNVGHGRWTGVITEAAASLIHNVYNKADWNYLSNQSGTTGGIAAYATKTGFTNCTNDGDIDAIRGAGGIVGWAANSCGIANCRNNGEISSTFSQTSLNYAERTLEYNQVGGIVGRVGGKGSIWNQPGYARVTRLVNCINNGGVSSVGPQTGGTGGDAEAIDTYVPYVGSLVGYFVTGANDKTSQVRIGNSVDYANPGLSVYGVAGIGVNSNCYYFYDVALAFDAYMAELLAPSFQLKEGDEEGTYDVRLIATVDDYENYQKAGFIVSIDGEDAVTYTTYDAWESILAEVGEDDPITCDPEAIGGIAAGSIFVQVLEGVADDAIIEVETFVVTMTGDVLYGDYNIIDLAEI